MLQTASALRTVILGIMKKPRKSSTKTISQGNNFNWHRQAVVLVFKYPTSGEKLWSKQITIADSNSPTGIKLDSVGNIYVAGSVRDGISANTDVFVLKLQ